MLTLGRTRGGGGEVSPSALGFFFSFFLDNKHQHLTFSVAVRLSLARIVMVSYYGYEICHE